MHAANIAYKAADDLSRLEMERIVVNLLDLGDQIRQLRIIKLNEGGELESHDSQETKLFSLK